MKTVLAITVLLSFVNAHKLWTSEPAVHGDYVAGKPYLVKTAYPLGNGRLGLMEFGPPGAEKFVFNVDSLWDGGPFKLASDSGGNQGEKYQALPGIRASIWDDLRGDGEIMALTTPGPYPEYGSNQVFANWTIRIDGVKDYSNYSRSLDLKTGVHATSYVANGDKYSTETFCSYPDGVCVHQITTSGVLPAVTVGLSNKLRDQDLLNTTCGDGWLRFKGVTQHGPPEGMKFDSITRTLGGSKVKTNCICGGKGLKIMVPEGQKTVVLVLGGGTNFDQSKGNAANKYSFKGEDPAAYVEKVTKDAAGKAYENLLKAHLDDFQALESAFSLQLPDTLGSAGKDTAKVITEYTWDGPEDPWLDNLIFDYGRYLLITASRQDSLPAGLQGRWVEKLNADWGADIHADINIEMNYWLAEQTGLSVTSQALYNYLEQNLVPRGSDTAKLLYNAPGWVTHTEMNIFGWTAMKDAPYWASYPAAAAWMVQQVADGFDYTGDVAWWKSQGYPLIKGVAEFWLSQLVEDEYTKDGTLVVNPCNSPEHGYITMGCTHYQQLIHSVFESILSGAEAAGDEDREFLNDVQAKLTKLDKGLHIDGKYGIIKEWKAPDSLDWEAPTEHRHLSHLVGWYPASSVSGYSGGYTDPAIQTAMRETLLKRGNGTQDANAVWNKVWRSACWARLNDTQQAYFELKLAVDVNFASNAFAMYTSSEWPFQIDGNYGYTAAVLSMLVVDLPLAYAKRTDVRTVVLGPAIPKAWAGGHVTGLRIRGGAQVDFSWDENGVVNKVKLVKGSKSKIRLVNVKGEEL